MRAALVVLLVAIVGRAAASHRTNINHGWGRRRCVVNPPPSTSMKHSTQLSSSAVMSSLMMLGRNNNSLARTSSALDKAVILSLLRGGSTSTEQRDDDDDDDDDLILNRDSGTDGMTNDDEEEELQKQQQRQEEEYIKLTKYHNEQHLLYQLRSTYLLEVLSSRGIPNLPTLSSISTSDTNKPSIIIDWDCALSTNDEPRSCLYSFDAQPYTKVIAPSGTNAWISLSALNRLRRTDATKVEPMWHSQYSILYSWFNEQSQYCILQHVGIKGFIISSILLDGMNGLVLRSLLLLSSITVLIILQPIIEFMVSRILVSTTFWSQWTLWSRILRAGFPLKLLLIQMLWKGIVSGFTHVESTVREYIVDMECEILEECVPITVGVGIDDDDDEEVDEGGHQHDINNNNDDNEYDDEDDEY
jgi:hypothetical protein